MEKVLSSHVGVKINEWYKMIRQFSVPDAEILKAEVEWEIDRMEEDQDLLIYYQLMCFRHQLMLDYIKPSFDQSISALVDKIENANHQLSGMLQYYNAFFRGMHEFSQKEYVQAIQYYKIAERQLALVVDEIEQAEFHFKVAEAYYIMKQTHVSMHHIIKALEIYDRYDLYKVRKIQSLFVIAENYDDFKRYEKSLPHLHKALNLAEEVNDQRLIAKTYLNLGNTYDRQQDYIKAASFYKKGLDKMSENNEDIKPRLFFSLSWTLFKSDNTREALDYIAKGIKSATAENNLFYKTLLNSLKTIYVDEGIENVRKMFKGLEEKKLYPYIEEFALSLANLYEKRNDSERVADYYRTAIEAQTEIQKGECLYEY
ncbi:Rap family tetratricopeptide repeat protein [Bacillus altitudinis]|uniref:Rap family tetratricopeptide repeat protein n=1 Tax=Bacillus altitudinis TaxID=293387 RepID=UPI0012DCFEFE|nr:Rap family tetratricopeptide repeat protein [Bacillus altitudinis]